MNTQQPSAQTRQKYTVVQKLEEEIELLKSTMSKINPGSQDPGDIWALTVYQKVISRRERLAQLFSTV